MSSPFRTIFYLPKAEIFAEPLPYHPHAVPLDSSTVLYPGMYLNQSELTTTGLSKAKSLLVKTPPDRLLRPVPSSDGPPYWSAIVYEHSGTVTVLLKTEIPRFATHYREMDEQGSSVYYAISPGNRAWETDMSAGQSGYFLTGGAGPNALWRIARIQADALNRQVLTLYPVVLTPTLAMPRFDAVSDQSRTVMMQHFEAFQKAIVRNAPFDAIDRANNLTEGIVSYCLAVAGNNQSGSLDQMLKEARRILDSKDKSKPFPLTYYAYNLAHVIRNLHARLHHNSSVGEGRTVRPEVGLNLSVTVSELLVEVGLGTY